MSQYALKVIQHGLEATAGTAVPATFKHFGDGTLHFDDAVITPDFATGILGGIAETTFIGDTGSTLTLPDTDLSCEAMIWLGNIGIKSLPGPASTFNFTFPTSSVNTIKTFTWELATATQEYEFAYGICSNMNFHADTGSNNGRVMYNAKIFGRTSAASTVTAGLDFLTGRQSLNINATGIKFDAAGTPAGTASPTTGLLKGFNIDIDTGWNTANARFADGRAAKDFSTPTMGQYKITGVLHFLMNATTVTEIGYARAGTIRIVSIQCAGTASRNISFNLPLVYTGVNELGTNSNGVIIVELPFQSIYSSTTTAQVPAIAVTATGSTTVT